MKRVIGLAVAALLMVSNFAVPAMANPTLGSITINKTVEGKVYDIYRVLDLSYRETSGTNEERFAYTINPDFQAFFDKYNGINGDRAKAVEFISKFAPNSSEFTDFSNAVKEYALELHKAGKLSIDVWFTETATKNTIVFENIPLGYYLFYPEGSLSGLCNMDTVYPGAVINIKHIEYPEIDKKIDDGDKGKAGGSYTVGDVIPYILRSQVPDTTGYDSYIYIVTDKMSKGLTFNDDVEIKVDGSPLSDDMFAVPTPIDKGDYNEIKIIFNNAKDIFKHVKGADIVITYSATLNDKAIIGPDGNSNSATIEYSNDPKVTDSTGTTPDVDIVKVFTFKLNVLKIDAETFGGDPDAYYRLNDATFSLWTTKERAGVDTRYYGGDTLYRLDDDMNPLTTSNNGEFDFMIGEGTFYLFEEKAPAGFHKTEEPYIFIVEAKVEDNELKSLIVSQKKPDDNKNIVDMEVDADTGIIEAVILNYSDSGGILPGTGGAGTKIYMMGGGLLLLGSVAGMFISNRKKNRKTVANY